MLFPDDELASSFLARFRYATTTIQIFHDKDPAKNEKTVKTFSGNLSDPANQDLLSWLVMKNNDGFGIFFMVNEGDGVIHPKRSTCRSSDSVVLLRSLFVDTDGQDTAPLQAFLAENDITPHAIIESSPGRYHYYILIDPLDHPDKKNTFIWQTLQTTLANLNSYDPTMKDVSRLLRIPGFYHQKKDPFEVALLDPKGNASDLLNRPYYDAFELFQTLKAKSQIAPKATYTPPPDNTKLTPGQRHNEINAYLGHVANDEAITSLLLQNASLGEDALITLATGHAARLQFQDWQQWLPNGKRYNELKQQAHDIAVKHRASLLPDDLKPHLNGTNGITPHFQATVSTYDPQLFLQAPGLIGKVTKDFASRSKDSIPQFEYAAARTLIAFLKSFNYLTKSKRPLPTIDYLMCLAPTGRGKSNSKDLLQEILVSLGFGRYITQKIRSDIGLDRALHDANGRLLIVHNEAHHFILNARKSTNDYMKKTGPWFLDIYDAYKQAIATTGITGNEKVKSYNHAYAQVGYLGYGVPIALEELFNAQTLHEGTMSRFIVLVADNAPIRPLTPEDCTPEPPVNSLSTYPMLKQLAEESGELKRQQLAEIEPIDPNDDDETTNRKKKKAAREKALIEINHGETRKIIHTPYTPEAFEELTKFYDSITKLRYKSNNLNGFYSRTVEHVIRAALTDADNGEIEKKHMEFAITSIMALTDHLRAEIGSSLDVGGQGRLEMRILKYLKELHVETQDSLIPESAIMRKLESIERQAGKDAIQSLIDDGQITLAKPWTENQKGKKIKRGLTLSNSEA